MGLPYETKPRGGIEIGSAEYGTINEDGTRTAAPGKAIVALGVPSRVSIVKVVVEQTDSGGSVSVPDGTGSDFTVDLYNLRAAADNQQTVDDDDNPVGRRCFRVMPSIPGENGLAEYYTDASNGGYGYPFFNQDQNQQTPVTGVADRLQQNQRVLYVVISGTDGDVFSIVVGTDSGIHGI